MSIEIKFFVFHLQNVQQNVIQKSIPVVNSRTNVNKFSGLVRPSSGYYSYNTEVDKFETVNHVSGNF